MQRSDDGEAAHELRDEAIAHEIRLFHLLQHAFPQRFHCSRLMPCPAPSPLLPNGSLVISRQKIAFASDLETKPKADVHHSLSSG